GDLALVGVAEVGVLDGLHDVGTAAHRRQRGAVGQPLAERDQVGGDTGGGVVAARGVPETGHHLVHDQQRPVFAYDGLQRAGVRLGEEVDLRGEDHGGHGAARGGEFVEQVEVVAEVVGPRVPAGDPHRRPVL